MVTLPTGATRSGKGRALPHQASCSYSLGEVRGGEKEATRGVCNTLYEGKMLLVSSFWPENERKGFSCYK